MDAQQFLAFVILAIGLCVCSYALGMQIARIRQSRAIEAQREAAE